MRNRKIVLLFKRQYVKEQQYNLEQQISIGLKYLEQFVLFYYF